MSTSLFIEAVLSPQALTVTLAQVLLCEVTVAGVTAAGSRERLPVDCSFLIQLVLVSVFSHFCLLSMCECVKGTGAL